MDLGFIAAMFKKDDTAFGVFLAAIISEQSTLLQGRIGASNYNDASSPVKDYAKGAEKCLVAADLVQRRITILLGNAQGVGQELGTSEARAQMKAYSDQGEALIAKILSGASTGSGSDIEVGTLVSDHFSRSHYCA